MTFFGFVLLPDRGTILESVRLNEKIVGSELKIDAQYFLPHVTVLQAKIRNTFDYREVLRNASENPGFSRELNTVTGSVYQDGDYVMWEIVNANWLATFNKNLVAKAAGHITVTPPVKPFSTVEEEESYLATGYKRNLKAYKPHITLGVSGEPVDVSVLQTPALPVKFRELLFTEHGAQGRIVRVIDRQPLKVQWD